MAFRASVLGMLLQFPLELEEQDQPVTDADKVTSKKPEH